MIRGYDYILCQFALLRTTMSQVAMELKQSVVGKVNNRDSHRDDPVRTVAINLDTEMVPRAR